MHISLTTLSSSELNLVGGGNLCQATQLFVGTVAGLTTMAISTCYMHTRKKRETRDRKFRGGPLIEDQVYKVGRSISWVNIAVASFLMGFMAGYNIWECN